MQPHTVVSREEWIAARKAHLAHEKEYTKARERLGYRSRWGHREGIAATLEWYWSRGLLPRPALAGGRPDPERAP